MEAKPRVGGRWSYSTEAKLVGIRVGRGVGERVRSITEVRSGLRGVSIPGVHEGGMEWAGRGGIGYGNIVDGIKGGGGK